MGLLDGRVCVVTGAGRGLGREHALLLAAEGARVVVNDLGGAIDGSGEDAGPAHEVVDEIKAAGGEAIANTDSVTSWAGAQQLVLDAINAYGRLDVLVNNAGILRDRSLVNLEEAEWDAVIAVHLKGHVAPTRWAAAHWRERAKSGETVKASVINTASGAMLGNPGQTNYSAAKAGIAAMTLVEAMELARYGVRANCLAPLARTRLTLQTPGVGDLVGPPADESFDLFHPGNVSPCEAHRATAGEGPAPGQRARVGGARLKDEARGAAAVEHVGAVAGIDRQGGRVLIARDREQARDLIGDADLAGAGAWRGRPAGTIVGGRRRPVRTAGFHALPPAECGVRASKDPLHAGGRMG